MITLVSMLLYLMTTVCNLPVVEYLGESIKQYNADDGYVLLVKQFHPFRFEYHGTSYFTQETHHGHPERVWQVKYNSDGTVPDVPAIYEDIYEIGQVADYTTVAVLVIDDDDDNRKTLLRNENNTVSKELTPYMVNYHNEEIPTAGTYVLDTADSIGVFGQCVASSTIVINPDDDDPGPAPRITYIYLPTVMR